MASEDDAGVGHKRANQGRLLYCGQLSHRSRRSACSPVSLPISPSAPAAPKKKSGGWNCFRQIHCSRLQLLRWRCVRHYPFVALAAMHSGVACRAQRDQVFIRVGSRMAAELPVVHLKIRHRATGLTPPAVATHDLLVQAFIRQRIQPHAGGFWSNHSQDALSRRFSRKACCCSPGKNL